MQCVDGMACGLPAPHREVFVPCFSTALFLQLFHGKADLPARWINSLSDHPGIDIGFAMKILAVAAIPPLHISSPHYFSPIIAPLASPSNLSMCVTYVCKSASK